MKEERGNKPGRRLIPSDSEDFIEAHIPSNQKIRQQTQTEQSVSLVGDWRTVFKLPSTAGGRGRSFRIFCLLFLAITIGWSADPKNDNIRAQEPNPSFEHQVPYVTARISILEQSEGVKPAHGTGFFYRSNFTLNDGTAASILLLISNKHVIGDPRGRMTIRVNKKKDDGSPDFGNVASITFSGFVDRYYPHPDLGVDLAAVDVTQLSDVRVGGKPLYFKRLGNEFLSPINYEKVAPGSDVLFVGYPNDFYDTRNNLPLARKGSLSSIPSVDFEGKGELVIDAEVFGGSSGSPVFIDWDNKYRLLGVLSRSVNRTERLVGRTIAIEMREHIGLGIVIKQRHVKELIDYTTKLIRTKN